MDSEKKQEYTRRVSQANSTELVIIIYDIALDYIKEAKDALKKGCFDDFESDIPLIQGCIYELLESLHPEYELAGNLRKLYGFCLRQISISASSRKPEGLFETEKVLKPLRDAYEQIKGENKNGPVMGNSQTVFAGLTYGKEELIESLSTTPNRGYLV
ncbi:MAG: flagellar protein FliS [Lachnospiraceae bacterium]|nr:flagellar protein FliS [Lachnospiraceae bacterium]